MSDGSSLHNVFPYILNAKKEELLKVVLVLSEVHFLSLELD
jgi:hypothetical protein